MSKIYQYGKQSICEEDKKAVLDVLESDFLTCGPKVKEFETEICSYTGAKYCIAVSSATAALHLAMETIGITKGDEVITSPNTFVASANCVIYSGGKPVFADIEPDTGNIDVKEIEKRITPKTKAIIPVHFAGQSCDMEPIYALAKKHDIKIIEDASHAIGSSYKGAKVGCCQYSDAAVFSFHPVKTITSGEGGAIVTNNYDLYKKIAAYRSHGVYKEGEMLDTWHYEMRHIGYNYRMSDLQAALGLSQLKKLNSFKSRRKEIVDYYNKHLNLPCLVEKKYSDACFHLYPILVEDRKDFYEKAKKKGLHLQIHYIPVHTQPYYKSLGYKNGDYPKAEAYYEKCISLPLYPMLTDEDLYEIVSRIKSIV
jgi:perosamine synthetase